MDNKLVYIADDEINICNIIKSFLTKEAFKVEIFNNGTSLLEAFKLKEADMLIIDIMMPGMDGYSLCSAIRERSNVPIIFVSAKDTETDKIAGLNLGGDDYLTKPFSPLELVARMKSIFRRIETTRTEVPGGELNTVADISLSLNLKQALLGNTNIGLTAMEFSLLNYLMVNKNRVVDRTELLEKLWGFDIDVSTRATDDMIKRIRKKLSNAGSVLKIETIRGLGFIIQDK